MLSSSARGSMMKTLIAFSMVVLAIVPRVAAKGAPARGCAPVVKKIESVVAAITRSSEAYWAHRAKFVALTHDPHPTAPETEELAAREKTKADPLKAAMPKTLGSLKGLVATAQSKKCLPDDQLLAVTEPAINLAKRVNSDTFPEKE
jgi:hypothetical protein